MSLLQLTGFSLIWLLIIYLFNSAVAKKFKKIDLTIAIIYISTVAVVGTFGEVLMDGLYNVVIGIPLWEYRVLPIHNAYTSYYSLVIWGMYGFYLYLLHDSFREYYNVRSIALLSLLIAFEGIILELLLNVSHLIFFNEYIFYYLPDDLWHLTSIQAIPVYFLAGFFITNSIRGFKSNPLFFSVMNGILVVTLVFFTN